MKLHVTTEFTYAVLGYNVTTFKPEDNHPHTGAQEVPDDAAAYGLKEGFAEEVDEEGKAVSRSPEDKARKTTKKERK